MGEEGVALEYGVAAPLVGREARDVVAVYADDAGVRVLEARDDPQEGRLAAAGGTEEGEELALLDLEGDALQRFEGAEGLGNTRNGNVGTFHRFSLLGSGIFCARYKE